MLAWLADFDGVTLDIGELVLKLVLTVLLPLVVGKCMTQFIPAVGPWVKKRKWPLKVVSIYALVALPWILTSRARDDGKFDQVTAESVFALLAWAIAMHMIFLVMNFSVSYGMSKANLLDWPELKAVVILASQKTLPVSIAVISVLPDSVGDEGLMSIACILAHLSQIVLDSFIIGAWVKEAKEQDTDANIVTSPTGGPPEDQADENGTVHGKTAASLDPDNDGKLEPRDGVTYLVVGNTPSRIVTFSDVGFDTMGGNTAQSPMPRLSRTSFV